MVNILSSRLVLRWSARINATDRQYNPSNTTHRPQLFQCSANISDVDTTFMGHFFKHSIPSKHRRRWDKYSPANTKRLYNICTTSAQRLRRWFNIVQMLYKYLVFAGSVQSTAVCPADPLHNDSIHLAFNYTRQLFFIQSDYLAGSGLITDARTCVGGGWNHHDQGVYTSWVHIWV